MIPGPRHPIRITGSGDHVTVSAGGVHIADSRRPMVLEEADYPPVYYLPREDVNFAALAASDHVTHCPYKGDATHYSLAGDGSIVAWSYEAPNPSAGEIRDYVAFYPDRVRIDVSPLHQGISAR